MLYYPINNGGTAAGRYVRGRGIHNGEGGRLKKSRTTVTKEQQPDWISGLPDHLLHHILSFIDMKFAVQTSVLSSRWRNVWKSLPFLHLTAAYFADFTGFSRFVIGVLSNRDYYSDVWALRLLYAHETDALLTNIVVVYAMLHNVKRLSVNSYEHSGEIGYRVYPVFFHCPSLTHLSLHRVPNNSIFPWKLPYLKCLYLERVSLHSWYGQSPEEGLFSQYVNLKSLTLVDCSVDSKSLKSIRMGSNSLQSLKITNDYYVFMRESCELVISMPNLSSFCYTGFGPLCFTSNGFNHLGKVKISILVGHMQMIDEKKAKSAALGLVKMLGQFRRVEHVSLSVRPFGFLSLVLDLLKSTSYPLTDVKCLEITRECSMSNRLVDEEEIAAVYDPLMAYFHENSPRAAVLMK